MSYQKTTKTTGKQKLVAWMEKKVDINPESTKPWTTSNNTSFKGNNLIDFISTWDFKKVEEIIKGQIKNDQKSYNSDITNSLNVLEENLSVFYDAHIKLLDSLKSIGELLSYTKWKDYFIKWYDNVTFELSDNNWDKINWIIEKLRWDLSDNDYKALLTQILKSVNDHSNKRLMDEKENQEVMVNTSSDIVNMFSSDNVPVVETSEHEEKEENINKSFDIKKHFMEDEKEVENKLNEDIDLEIQMSSENSEVTEEQTNDGVQTIVADNDDVVEEQTNDSVQTIVADSDRVAEEQTNNKVEENEETQVTDFSNTNSFSNFETIEDMDFEDEEEEPKASENIEEEDIDESKLEKLEPFKFNIV